MSRWSSSYLGVASDHLSFSLFESETNVGKGPTLLAETVEENASIVNKGHPRNGESTVRLMNELAREVAVMEEPEPASATFRDASHQHEQRLSRQDLVPPSSVPRPMAVSDMAGSVLGGALNAAIWGTAVAYSVFQLWKHPPGTDQDVEQHLKSRSEASHSNSKMEPPPVVLAAEHQEEVELEEGPPPYVDPRQSSIASKLCSDGSTSPSPSPEPVSLSTREEPINSSLALMAAELNQVQDHHGDEAMEAISERLQRLISLGNEALLSTPVMSQREWEEEEEEEEKHGFGLGSQEERSREGRKGKQDPSSAPCVSATSHQPSIKPRSALFPSRIPVAATSLSPSPPPTPSPPQPHPRAESRSVQPHHHSHSRLSVSRPHRTAAEPSHAEPLLPLIRSYDDGGLQRHRPTRLPARRSHGARASLSIPTYAASPDSHRGQGRTSSDIPALLQPGLLESRETYLQRPSGLLLDMQLLQGALERAAGAREQGKPWWETSPQAR